MKLLKKLHTPLLLLLLTFFTINCKKKGCTDNAATNYDSKAKKDDGSCVLPPPPTPTPTVEDKIIGNTWSHVKTDYESRDCNTDNQISIIVSNYNDRYYDFYSDGTVKYTRPNNINVLNWSYNSSSELLIIDGVNYNIKTLGNAGFIFEESRKNNPGQCDTNPDYEFITYTLTK